MAQKRAFSGDGVSSHGYFYFFVLKYQVINRAHKQRFLKDEDLTKAIWKLLCVSKKVSLKSLNVFHLVL